MPDEKHAARVGATKAEGVAYGVHLCWCGVKCGDMFWVVTCWQGGVGRCMRASVWEWEGLCGRGVVWPDVPQSLQARSGRGNV